MSVPMETTKYRLRVKFEEESEKYMLKGGEKSYIQQYSHVYAARLQNIKDELIGLARAKWPDARVVDRIVSAAEITSTSGEEQDESKKNGLIAVIGTSFKEQDRPNVLDEYRSEILHSEDDGSGEGMGEALVDKKYQAGENDAIALEDESGRVRLAGDGIPVQRLVTGLSMAALGTLDEKGELQVIDFIGPGFPRPNSDSEKNQAAQKAQGKKVLLLSGLLGNASGRSPDDAKFTLLCDWLTGSLASSELSTLVSSVCACYVAGDLGGDLGTALQRATTSIGSKGLKPSSNGHNSGQLSHAARGSSINDPDTQQLRDADIALARLSALLPVVLIPGEQEPTNISLPQQPLHPLLLPNASRYDTFHTTTNPHESILDDAFLLMGHAGQPVHDMLKHADYSTLNSSASALDTRTFPGGECLCIDRKGDGPDDHFLAALEDTLYWRHIAPTAPDSLSSYPFKASDPFVIDADNAPTILFSGGASHFATSLATRQSDAKKAHTRIVALPSFAQSGVAAIVDLDTLHIEQLSFSAP